MNYQISAVHSSQAMHAHILFYPAHIPHPFSHGRGEGGGELVGSYCISLLTQVVMIYLLRNVDFNMFQCFEFELVPNVQMNPPYKNLTESVKWT